LLARTNITTTCTLQIHCTYNNCTGGGDSITLSAGDDATEEFNALHSAKARGMLDAYYIGDLAVAPPAAPAAAALTNGNSKQQQYAPLSSPPLNGKTATAEPVSAQLENSAETDPVALNPKKKISVALVEREELTYNTRRLRFALPTPQHRLGLPVGKHLFVSGMWRGEFVMRAYTPVTGDEESARGHVDLIIKVYHPCARFPAGGKMSQLLDSLVIGDTIDMKGPLGEITYHGNSSFTIRHEPRIGTCLGMMAGGTGITPMYQVAKTILEDSSDPTKVWLLLANQSEDDILLRTELDALAAAHPDRFKVHYTVDRVVGDAAAWKGSVGFISEAMIAEHLPPAAEDTLAFMCGPPGMLKFACIPNLQKLGYSDKHYFAF
jgi:nitrate reductase (NAD(P)H)